MYDRVQEAIREVTYASSSTPLPVRPAGGPREPDPVGAGHLVPLGTCAWLVLAELPGRLLPQVHLNLNLTFIFEGDFLSCSGSSCWLGLGSCILLLIIQKMMDKNLIELATKTK